MTRNQSLEELEYIILRKYLKLADSDGVSEEARLSRAMAKELTPRQRQMMELYYQHQLPMREIARRLGVNVSTVSRTLDRGRLRLRRCLRYGSTTLLKCAEERIY